MAGAKFSESARVFTIINSCKETIWPAIIPGESFNGGGFALKPGQSIVLTAPVAWSGRTGCKFDQNGQGKCDTGNCGTSLKCTAMVEPPVSLAEFTLASPDFYDVSLVDGFNLPISIKAVNGSGNCSTAACDGDLRQNCLRELRRRANGKVVACRSACDVFNTDEYCCRAVHGNSATCQPTSYSKKFKEVCTNSYRYAYDNPSSIFKCSGTDYDVAFCASRNQTACTYHNKKLVGSGSNGLRSLA
ncbi:hypothetical protein RJ639_004124, partial [Escallonia herrerae]